MAGKLSKKDRELREHFRVERAAREACRARLAALCSEDDFAGALPRVWRYPNFPDRDLSPFEADCRDWGFVLGLAFGIVLADQGGMSHEQAADAAYGAARAVFTAWSGVTPARCSSPVSRPASRC